MWTSEQEPIGAYIPFLLKAISTKAYTDTLKDMCQRLSAGNKNINTTNARVSA